MRSIIRHRPSPALVIACAALLIALTGTSIAAVQLTLPRNSVGSLQLRNNAVTSPKIKNSAVTGAKIASNAVTSAKVLNGTLVAADFASGVLPAPTAPTDAFVRFLNGPIAVPTASTTLTSLTISQAGNYVISAKAYVDGGSATATCRLQAGSDFDEAQATAGNTLSLIVGHNYSAAGTADFA